MIRLRNAVDTPDAIGFLGLMLLSVGIALRWGVDLALIVDGALLIALAIALAVSIARHSEGAP